MASKAVTKALPQALKEVRLHLCQSGPRSAGLRQYIQSNYSLLKSSNPDLPILIREASGTPARAFARFDRGVEKSVELEGASASDVEKKLSDLLTGSA
ncbi:putative nadh-ubiquinone oxidoreductase 10.5 kda subunit [Tilletiaria anomala UBC 951]|uniref:Putative nadh-ubiquinone oxidoreductase 10.5 kDa subunit n=1 Tax=Tilletiaria anomala (strain ATCC 24038 / CBS 436.72 / UBC 951) TaxID=1037660 RepID=A0A066V9W3_TILAU|nr:putative nadh-ubiquinone oxidoreductase 10.5 kda subunit [Tilletiaria anomala UBC 951]KDN38261.1 putative nadh-ubiquinone oxidoreductase 10.5 kda subunit [Tilletiaria anomala UBC 951]